MELDLFGFLTTNQWLAILRIGIGLWWLKSFLHKPHKRFVSGQMTGWTIALAENHPVPAYGKLIKALVGPNAAWFPYLILLAEFSVAIGMILGFLGLPSLIVAIFLNLNYIVLAGVKPKDITINKAYQCEQGQNWSMLIAELVLLATLVGSGCTWGLDHALGIFPCGI
jgi:thiosulfate dehydrogenase [quinone] large subunit